MGGGQCLKFLSFVRFLKNKVESILCSKLAFFSSLNPSRIIEQNTQPTQHCLFTKFTKTKVNVLFWNTKLFIFFRNVPKYVFKSLRRGPEDIAKNKPSIFWHISEMDVFFNLQKNDASHIHHHQTVNTSWRGRLGSWGWRKQVYRLES